MRWRARLSQPPSAGSANIPAHLLQEVIDAARATLPNEAVGLLVGPAHAATGGLPQRFIGLRNRHASPYRYEVVPEDQVQLMLELEAAGEVIWAIVHSHVGSAAEPSAADLAQAFYPDSLYLICSLAQPVPVVRAWQIRYGEVSEVTLAVA